MGAGVICLRNVKQEAAIVSRVHEENLLLAILEFQFVLSCLARCNLLHREVSLNNSLCIFLKSLKKIRDCRKFSTLSLSPTHPFPPLEAMPLEEQGRKSPTNIWRALEGRSLRLGEPPGPVLELLLPPSPAWSCLAFPWGSPTAYQMSKNSFELFQLSLSWVKYFHFWVHSAIISLNNVLRTTMALDSFGH